MTILRSIAAVVLLSVSLWAEPQWTHSYEEAKAQALHEGKGVMLMLSREGCSACWYMENIVFEDKKLQGLLMDNFIPVYLNVDEDKLPEGFTAIGTPTFYFTKADGQKLGYRLNGAINVKDFTDKINAILLELKE